MYNNYGSSIRNNFKHVQITTKYQYAMMRKKKLKVFCKVAIEESCKKHKIKIIILKVVVNHVHMIIDCPRTMSDARLLQMIKGLSSYLLFRICPDLRKRYLKGHFWNGDIFVVQLGQNLREYLIM